ncbi:AIR synthase related protein domain protein [Ignisphaera aggregans DSM 17230]|uniref:AIR synthase related protein domain protein n=1 Tax=Ignisphaera aggregans (strain DSM 17230 / JCM 13409 / AQ1.S1) TaxID=583356 RepID=E0SNT1_IGNAA|nr:AIR synthase related protein domain protein [Ignisphaera aggregans DSM 17230]
MKLSPSILESKIFRRIGVLDPSVIVGPAIGEDASIIDIGDDKVLVVHSDAISGSIEMLGWLAVHIAANDIAVRGVRPRWFLISLFIPETSDVISIVDKISDQIDRAAKELGIMVVGGHTETTTGIDRPLAGMTMIGIGHRNKIVTTSGAREGNILIATKAVALEGTSILCTDFAKELIDRGVDTHILERCARFIEEVSIVKEALALAEKGLVTSMHDPTEGGVIGGVTEIAYASNKTIELWLNEIPIREETRIICKKLGLDPLRLISSGTLLATVPRDRVEDAINLLKSIGIEARAIGVVKNRGRCLVEMLRDSNKICIEHVEVEDELFRLIKTYHN